MRCTHVTHTTQPVHFDFFIGAPADFQCERDAIPGMQHCQQHATKKEIQALEWRLKSSLKKNRGKQDVTGP